MVASEDIKNKVFSLAQELGFEQFSWIPLHKPLRYEFYQPWLDKGMHADMKYLEQNSDKRAKPQLLQQDLQSIMSFTYSYWNHPKPKKAFKNLRIARYAQGEDYHYWIKEKLEQLVKLVKESLPDAVCMSFVDSGPVLERSYAEEGGLGWAGKNTCLIHPRKGSLFFISEILLSIPAPGARPELVHDFCGNCQKCIDICPTQAIESPRVLNANKCISYWTIESRKIPPAEIRDKISDWLFGCDLCQTVCPWNNKVFQSTQEAVHFSDIENEFMVDDLRFILTASGKQIEKRILGTPLKRAGPWGLRRNALIIIGNRKIEELKHEVKVYTQDEKLAELAQWCLSKLNS